jgi:pyruvate dehydrogenase kinase 2/3/4
MKLSIPSHISSDKLGKLINKYANYFQTSLNLNKMLKFGEHKQSDLALLSSKFLRNELPIRLAHMIKEFDSIRPRDFLQTTGAQTVRRWYEQSFIDLMDSNDDPVMFTQLCKNILDRHQGVVQVMATGVMELKQNYDIKYMKGLHTFLDRFYSSRIGIRWLMQQHIELCSGKQVDGYMGTIEIECDPVQIAENASTNAKFLCEHSYGIAPEYDITCIPLEGRTTITFPYISSHLYHILFELMKNSMRAVTETHKSKSASKMPRIHIIVVEGNEDLTIKICDEGGGIPRSNMAFIYSYLYTTAEPPPIHINPYAGMNSAPLAGFGYGLPLSRLYARYMGGDLNILSIDGHGTDAFVYMRRIDAKEQLPVYADIKKISYAPTITPTPTIIQKD